MRKFEGTQGEWEIKMISGENILIKKGSFEKLGSNFRSYQPIEISNRYNAKLIAAAPDLLEQLQKIVADYESEIHDRYDGTHSLEELLADTKDAHAAINKALGGE